MELDLTTDILIVGSGPAGTAAAMALADRGLTATMLDGGVIRDCALPDTGSNFYDYAERSHINALLLGRHYEGIEHLHPGAKPLPSIVAVPAYRHELRKSDWLQPLEEDNVTIVQSLAKGGLANVWGAAMAYRYVDADLQGYPFSTAELDPYYDQLTREIGISGSCDDDMSMFFGSTEGVLPPLDLAVNSNTIWQHYCWQTAALNRRGMFLGRQRSAVLSRDLHDRAAYTYRNDDYYSNHSSVYRPTYTLERLIRQQRLRYFGGVVAERWRRRGDELEVHFTGTERQASGRAFCRSLILAAGGVNSPRIVLRSFDDRTAELPLLDNPLVEIPFILPGRVGQALDVDGFGFAGIGCMFCVEGFSSPLHAPLYETMSVPRAELFRQMPLCASTNRLMVELAAPGLMFMLLYFPSDALPAARLRLGDNGRLLVRGPAERLPRHVVKRVIGLCRRLGLWGHSWLAKQVAYGGAMHYAGALPMRHAPASRYETDSLGRLAAEPAVVIADGAALPYLPSKNHTLTVMANAMRVASHLAERRAAAAQPSPVMAGLS